MKIFVLSALTLATYVSAGCDEDLAVANAINLTQACTSDIQGGTPPTISTVLSDWQSNGNSVYQFGICGSTNCLSQFHELQQTYTTCTPTNVTSYSAAIQALNTTCDNVTSTVANYTGTCNTTNYADIYWAKHVATLSADCASALTNFSYTASSNWYSVVQAINLTSNNLTDAFCGSVACVNLTTDNKAWLPNCNSNTGDNLHNTTTNLLTYCHQVNNPTTTVAPTTSTAAPNTTEAPSNSTTAAPSNSTTAAPSSNTTAAPSNSTSSPTPTPASTTPASNSSNTTTTTAPDTITLAPNATTTAAPEVATTTTAPSSATTTVAPASATTTVAATTVAPTTATPTPTPTQSSASTISGLFAVTLVAAVLA